MDYRKFVVLTRSRTGSNLVIDMLKSHPSVHAKGEILGRLAGRSCEEVLAGVFHDYPPEVRAVGFKLFYYHPLDDRSGDVWKRLRALDDLHVVHLKRRNILRTLLSRKIAGRTGEWHQRDAAGRRSDVDGKRVTFTAEELTAGFEQTRGWETKYAAMFEDRPVLELWYEELIEDPAREFARMTGFLGVEPLSPSTRLERQNPEPLRTLIRNYDELKESFRGSHWETFFPE